MLALSSRFEFNYLHGSFIVITFILSNIIQARIACCLRTGIVICCHVCCKFYSGYLDVYFPMCSHLPKIISGNSFLDDGGQTSTMSDVLRQPCGVMGCEMRVGYQTLQCVPRMHWYDDGGQTSPMPEVLRQACEAMGCEMRVG